MHRYTFGTIQELLRFSDLDPIIKVKRQHEIVNFSGMTASVGHSKG